MSLYRNSNVKGMAPWGRMTTAGGVAGVVTSVLFLAASLVNMISLVTNETQELESFDLANPPPPPPPPEVTPPQDKERREETLELVKPRPRMVFNQPDVGLNPGTGGVSLSGDLSFDFSADETEMVFEMGELDKNPRAISQVSPIYPFSLGKTGIDGQVDLQFIVNPNGRVESIIIIGGDGGGFAKEAIIAVKKWRFKPGKKDGNAVYTRMRISIFFVLNKKKR